MRTPITAAALSTLLVLALAGCTTPEPPEPTPTPAFSSEEEAFAAAEATYRAYVDALNQVDLSDPETFEPVYELTTGEANAGARETFSQMNADGWTVDGPTVIDVLEPGKSEPGYDSVELDVCLNVSQVTLIDSEGQSVVASDRRDVQSMRVTLEPRPADGSEFAISRIDGREDGPSCES